jgi:hypothetical protein
MTGGGSRDAVKHPKLEEREPRHDKGLYEDFCEPVRHQINLSAN